MNLSFADQISVLISGREVLRMRMERAEKLLRRLRGRGAVDHRPDEKKYPRHCRYCLQTGLNPVHDTDCPYLDILDFK